MFSDIETNDERRKKTNKPLMEKKRRARINRCLNELKDILIMDKHASAGHAKWEKADILEMTVEYVKKIRSAKGLTPYVACLPTSSSPNEPDEAHHSELGDKFDSGLGSPTPSPSSAEWIPPSSKRRRISQPEPPIAPTPTHSLPHPAPIMPIPTAPALNPNLGFMAQHLFALQQYHQHIRIAASVPNLLPSSSLPTSLPINLSTPAWRAT